MRLDGIEVNLSSIPHLWLKMYDLFQYTISFIYRKVDLLDHVPLFPRQYLLLARGTKTSTPSVSYWIEQCINQTIKRRRYSFLFLKTFVLLTLSFDFTEELKPYFLILKIETPTISRCNPMSRCNPPPTRHSPINSSPWRLRPNSKGHSLST